MQKQQQMHDADEIMYASNGNEMAYGEGEEPMFKVTQPGSHAEQDLEQIAHQLNAQLNGVMETLATPKSQVTAQGSRSAISHQKSYNYAKQSIKAAIAHPNYWPEGMKHPSEYRKFYMANDLSFCGFSKDIKGVIEPSNK